MYLDDNPSTKAYNLRPTKTYINKKEPPNNDYYSFDVYFIVLIIIYSQTLTWAIEIHFADILLLCHLIWYMKKTKLKDRIPRQEESR